MNALCNRCRRKAAIHESTNYIARIDEPSFGACHPFLLLSRLCSHCQQPLQGIKWNRAKTSSFRQSWLFCSTSDCCAHVRPNEPSQTGNEGATRIVPPLHAHPKSTFATSQLVWRDTFRQRSVALSCHWLAYVCLLHATFLLVAPPDSDRCRLHKAQSSCDLCEDIITTNCEFGGDTLPSFSLFLCLVSFTSKRVKNGLSKQEWTHSEPRRLDKISPDKLKTATLGRERCSQRGGGGLKRGVRVTVLKNVTLVRCRFCRWGEERRTKGEEYRMEGKEGCAWIINRRELYTGDRNGGWIISSSRGARRTNGKRVE